MTWQPGASIETLRERAAFLSRVRNFFAERQVMEVDTPLLAAHGATDVHLKSLAVYQDDICLGFLQTSPEFMMKRLLAAGSGCIYQLAKAFRGEEKGPRHLPEFTLLEWYRVGFDMFDLIDEVLALIQHEILGLTVKKIAYNTVFLNTFGVDPLIENLPKWQALVAEHVAMHAVPDQQSDCLDALITHVLSPKWPVDQITCVYDYPAEQAALACLDPDNSLVAKRFEVFLGAVELANGYHELTDAKEQAERMAKDNARRQAAGLPVMVMDDELLAALDHGLPDCAGVALGLDRLFMLKKQKNCLGDVVSFAI